MIRSKKGRFKIQKIAAISAVLFLAGAIISAYVGGGKTVLAAPSSVIYIDPASKTVDLNSDFTLDVMIDPGSNQVNGVGLRMTYDPAKFRLDSISNAGAAFAVALPGGSIDNVAGTASADFGIAVGGPSVTAVSKVATLTFHSLAVVENSPIAFANDTYAVASGEGADVLTARNQAIVTVGGITYGNADFANLAADWLQVGSPQTDINADGVVNTRDLGIMMSNWQ